MQISETLVKQITEAVIVQMQNRQGDSVSAVPSSERGRARRGGSLSEGN